MSYAIEAKKRKFERILETLTDTSSASSRTKPAHDYPPTQSVTALNVIDPSKRRRVTPVLGTRLNNASTTSLSTHYLPSSRSAFLERLETFRNVTRWHIPSTSSINAAEWAKRGWLCQDTDTVACPSCKERLFVDLETDERQQTTLEPANDALDNGNTAAEDEIDEDPLMVTAAVYAGLLKRYSEMIITAHKDGCPWRRRGCDSSIQRIEGLLNANNALSALKIRYNTIVDHAEEVPIIANLPSREGHTIDEERLTEVRVVDQTDLNVNALKLAVCGWQRKEADVVECRHCFRSLGLWLYRGSDPTMEHLDSIDSHLDYCPWRSADAQDTEIMTEKRLGKEKLPGWLLVYLAVVKDNTKRRGNPQHSRDGGSMLRPATAPGLDAGELEGEQDEPTAEQRERKMKDLLRRIKELKKPFNVKSLLRKKDKILS